MVSMPQADSELGAGELNTPIPKDVIKQAKEETEHILSENDDDLVDVLENIQRRIDRAHRTDGSKHYNEILDKLVGNLPEDNLYSLALMRDRLLVFVAGAEMWGWMKDEISLSDNEARAARDAHQLFIEQERPEYAATISVMAVNVETTYLRQIENALDIEEEVNHLPSEESAFN